MYDQGSMDRIGRLMSLRDLVTAGQMAPDAAPLPMNTLRNNTTGAEYQFESSPQGGAGPRPAARLLAADRDFRPRKGLRDQGPAVVGDDQRPAR
jgi:hypothetical protein